MARTYLGSCLLLSISVASHLWSQDKRTSNDTDCGKAPHPMHLSIRHIEGKGIGYSQGYTTLEGFFSPLQPWQDKWIPFLDLRGHLFNDNKWASNAGIGLRYLAPSRVWGINGYYDYRQTLRRKYNQVALGLESLGKIWDFRLNGYLPVGKTTTSLFGAQPGGFREHYFYISRQYEFAMKGINAEVAAHVDRIQHFPFYFAAGPYYLQGEGKVAWGGQLRATMDIFDYVKIEGNTSYDSVFKWIGQGQVSVMIPFGGKRTLKKQDAPCSKVSTLARRALQRVDRTEIIPVDKTGQNVKAINPLTGQPYFFWFVDNTSHSAGTFESPFSTLADAQNASSSYDVIYVFPGDGTTTGLSSGITLKDYQKLFGAGIDHTLLTTLGSLVIPAQASGYPIFTKIASSVVVCASNNEIAGIQISVTDVKGVVCHNITNANIHHNIIFCKGTKGVPLLVTAEGIALENCAGQIVVSHNTITGQNRSFSVHVASITPEADYVITNNEFLSSPLNSGATGIELGMSNPSARLGHFNSIVISNNSFTGHGGASVGKAIGGIGFGGKGYLILEDNIFSNQIASLASVGVVAIFDRIGNMRARILNNQWVNSSGISLHYEERSFPGLNCVVFKNNTSRSSPAYQFVNSNPIPASFILDASGNVGTALLGSQVITTGVCP